MLCMLVTFDTFQFLTPLMSLSPQQLLNMLAMFVTFDVSHLFNPLRFLIESQLANIPLILVTLDTSQFSRGERSVRGFLVLVKL